jgi:hypothetical protein
MNTSTISILVIVILGVAALIFVVFARRQIMTAFFPNRVQQKSAPSGSPLSVDRLLTRAYARRDTGDQRGARADFEEVLRREPAHPEADIIRQEIARLR